MTTRLRRITPIAAALAALGFAAALPAFAAVSADTHKEIQTAATHAEFAVKGKNIETVHLHLHHVINCIVGPGGAGFDAAVGDPCNDMGKGALHDASGSGRAVALLNQSLRLANIGVEIKNRHASQAVAVATRDLLELAQKAGSAPRK